MHEALLWLVSPFPNGERVSPGSGSFSSPSVVMMSQLRKHDTLWIKTTEWSHLRLIKYKHTQKIDIFSSRAKGPSSHIYFVVSALVCWPPLSTPHFSGLWRNSEWCEGIQYVPCGIIAKIWDIFPMVAVRRFFRETLTEGQSLRCGPWGWHFTPSSSARILSSTWKRPLPPPSNLLMQHPRVRIYA